MTAAWQASPTFGATASVVSSMKTSRLRISSPSGFSLFEIRTPPSELKSRYARRRSADARSTNGTTGPRAPVGRDRALYLP